MVLNILRKALAQGKRKKVLAQDCLALNALQRTATHCNTLQHTATHCNTLQYTAKHCKKVLAQDSLA